MQRKLSRNKRKFSELKAYKQEDECTYSQIFVQAHDYPAFFNENLIDDDRTIKIFYNQPYAHQTIFYFQMLKLTYETEDTDYQKYLVKIFDLLDNPEFQFVVPQEDNYYYLGIGDSRMKRMMQQFLEELGEGNISVSQIIAKYPIIDKIMVLFLRTLLVIAGKCESFDEFIQPVELYQFLADYFEIEITYFTNCLNFNKSDLFVYFQAENEIYLAYISPKNSEQQILSSNEFYHPEPQQAFNISSVKRMISEIDIPIEVQCFNLHNYNQSSNYTEYVDFDYSNSQEVRHPSKSIQENSQLKFSYLINDDISVLQNMNLIKSNKVLEKEIIGQKKIQNIAKVGWKDVDCFEIKEAPLQLQNAVSPSATPKQTRFASFGKADIPFWKQNCNIYQKKYKKNPQLQDTIKEQHEMVSTGQSQIFSGKKLKKDSTRQIIKKQTQPFFGKQSQEQYHGPAQKTLKSLYEMRSIKSIISSNDSQSYILDTPIKTSFNQSRKQTTKVLAGIMNKIQQTHKGYTNSNISKEFTSSLILKEMKDPFKSKIETIKTRARRQRKNIQNMMLI